MQISYHIVQQHRQALNFGKVFLMKLNANVATLFDIKTKNVTSNKSVEHRVIVNSEKDRVSLAFFYNPKSDIPIQPLQELLYPLIILLYTLP
ncbi:unnamed protein product [Arabis nemorensis]|uniref:Isopenicillin N synthase-like Fe(2+) 2OG dioxygenase domain-containing protein n=1 Tax=Arabis nemorensis TaxID=586526 RepID=A0A565CHP8_9BRAS|nr:unnamed protein product [Arabis nemorensis]